MTTITGTDNIRRCQLLAQRSAIKLEKLGMKRRGRSLAVMLKEHYGLKKSASYDAVLACIDADLAKLDEQAK